MALIAAVSDAGGAWAHGVSTRHHPWAHDREITFYYDLGSPYAYLAAERLHTVLPEPEPEQRAATDGLPPVRWPDPWPSDYLFAMRAAVHAFDAAHERGVFGVPTVAVGDKLFWGDDRLEVAREAASGRGSP